MIYIKSGGLCNRMRSIASAIALGKFYHEGVIVLWQLDQGLNCEFSDLFEAIDCVKVISFRRWSLKRLLIWMSMKFSCQCFDGITSWDTDKRKHGRNIYIATPHQFCKEISYNDFVPLSQHIERAKSILGKSKDFIGIHIRRTDNAKSIHNSPTELFIRKMNDALQERSHVRFFLATGSKEEEQKLRSQFNDSIISQNNKDLSRSSKQGIQDALVDLICLSYASEIWGSYWSSFSETAAVWNGNKPLNVLTVEKQ